MAAVFSSATKTMLKNVIRHTNSHNKTVEEAEMWQQYERRKDLGGLDPSNPSFGHDDRCSGRSDRGDRRRKDYWSSRSEKRAYLSTSYRSRRAHMDEEEEKVKGGSSTSTYWMRQLDKLEMSDPNRWDHSGYRELYPNDFRSDRSDSDSDGPRLQSPHKKKHRKSSTKKKKKKKKKKHRSKAKKNREKKKSSLQHRKPARRRSPSSTSQSDSESSASSSSPRPVHSHTSSAQRYDMTRSDRHTPPHIISSSSYSGSDLDSCSKGHSPGHKHQRRKRTADSRVPKRQHFDKTKSRTYSSSEGSSSGSYSDTESDSRERSPLHRRKPRKRTRDSPASTSSTDRSDSVSSPERKRVKTGKPARSKRTENENGSKVKRKQGRKSGHSKHRDREQVENELVVEMWKEVNGRGGSSDRGFDQRLRREISSQYHRLKRQYSQQKYSDQGVKVNGNSSVARRKRTRYSSPSSYSSDSD